MYFMFHKWMESNRKELDLNEFEPIEEAEKIKTEYMTRENLKILEKLTDKAFTLRHLIISKCLARNNTGM